MSGIFTNEGESLEYSRVQGSEPHWKMRWALIGGRLERRGDLKRGRSEREGTCSKE